MGTAAAVLARQSRHRTPEEYHRAYQQYRQDIEPVVAMMVRIRSLATPHIHLRQRADGTWEVMSDPDEGLPPEVLQTLRLLEKHVRDMALAYGLVIEEDGA